MIQLILFALLAVLCIVWLAREAQADANPTPSDAGGIVRKEQLWMLGAFAALIVGIVLTG